MFACWALTQVAFAASPPTTNLTILPAGPQPIEERASQSALSIEPMETRGAPVYARPAPLEARGSLSCGVLAQLEARTSLVGSINVAAELRTSATRFIAALLENKAGVAGNRPGPAEFLSALLAKSNINIEARTNATRQASLPLEALAAAIFNISGLDLIQLEIRSAIARVFALPAESLTAANSLLATRLEALAAIARSPGLPAEARGAPLGRALIGAEAIAWLKCLAVAQAELRTSASLASNARAEFRTGVLSPDVVYATEGEAVSSLASLPLEFLSSVASKVIAPIEAASIAVVKRALPIEFIGQVYPLSALALLRLELARSMAGATAVDASFSALLSRSQQALLESSLLSQFFQFAQIENLIKQQGAGMLPAEGIGSLSSRVLDRLEFMTGMQARMQQQAENIAFFAITTHALGEARLSASSRQIYPIEIMVGAKAGALAIMEALFGPSLSNALVAEAGSNLVAVSVGRIEDVTQLIARTITPLAPRGSSSLASLLHAEYTANLQATIILCDELWLPTLTAILSAVDAGDVISAEAIAGLFGGLSAQDASDLMAAVGLSGTGGEMMARDPADISLKSFGHVYWASGRPGVTIIGRQSQRQIVVVNPKVQHSTDTINIIGVQTKPQGKG